MEELRPHAERKYRLPRNGYAAIAAIDFDHPIFIERAGELPADETPRLSREIPFALFPKYGRLNEIKYCDED